jgi:hypothetical protein
VNQLGAEFIFKGGDLFADGRLTNSTLLCDSGEALFFNYRDENLHCIEFVLPHSKPPDLRGLNCEQSAKVFSRCSKTVYALGLDQMLRKVTTHHFGETPA